MPKKNKPTMAKCIECGEGRFNAKEPHNFIIILDKQT